MKFLILATILTFASLQVSQAQAEPAYVVALVKIKDSEKMKKYLGLATPIIESYNGIVINKGKILDALSSTVNHDIIAIAKFPNHAAISDFYNSPEYQAIIKLRDQAADVTLFTFQEQKKTDK